MRRLTCLLTLTALLAAPAAAQDERYETWPLLADPFPSTGGGGIMIHGYKPVVADGKCATPFTARTPTGESFPNIVEFTAVPTQGGILCTDGKWRSVDGSASGTTPFRVFIKDGLMRGSP
jgi:hypothetical protein